MTKKTILTIAAILLLAGFSLYVNRYRFEHDSLQVGSRSLPPRGQAQRLAQFSQVNPVIFLLSRQEKLSSVRVIPLSDVQTNKYPHPIWELISDSNSVPIKDFQYGNFIRGMKSSVKGAKPEPLQPGVPYRLIVEAGSEKAEHDFTPVPRMR